MLPSGSKAEIEPTIRAEAAAPADRGWYLYGIIRRPEHGDLVPAASIRHDTDDVQLLEQTGLAAVVRSVPLADYEPDALRLNMQDPSWLATMARHHHEVIESIHRLRAILPSKFGCVYPDEPGLRAALAETTAILVDRLEYVADCDEWTVYLYADRPTLERRLVELHPMLQRFQREVANASAGRAYLLKRKMADELDKVREPVASELARTAYERLSRYARAGKEQPPATSPENGQSEIILLQAIFLVPRAHAEDFLDAVENIASHGDGLRGESSGPWPPYSFATLDEEQLGDEQHP